eukprot:Em0002g1807a
MSLQYFTRVLGWERVVEPLTAGIIPHQVDSPYSNMIIYDLAGHHQFFSSQSACLEAIFLNSPAIILLLQDVTKDFETMAKEVHYWSTMIDNVCYKCPQKSSVIVVGTHADLLKSKQLTKKKQSDLDAVFKMAASHQTLVAVITVNLTNIYSAAMDQFRALLYSRNKEVISMSPPISFMCHIMLAFLKERLPLDMHAILLSDLLSRLDTDQDKFINPDITAIVPLLKSLSEKALVSIDRPSSATVPSNSFCWSVIVKSIHQFFTPRFHHVLLHRLPLEFALPDSQTTSQPFNRLCDVWSRGIKWLSETGVTTIVEMSESFQTISLTMSSPNKASPKYLELAHSVHEVIKKTRQEFCPYLEVLEVVSCPPECSSDHSIDTRVELSRLRKAILEKETHVVDVSGKTSVVIDEWKKMEPHLSYLVEDLLIRQNIDQDKFINPDITAVVPALKTLSEKEPFAHQPLSEMIGQEVKMFQDETPTLLKLISFSERGVNLAEQIGVNYLMFGMILLQDDNGAIVKALEEEHRGNAEKINTAIFQKWLDGKGIGPVTWSTLVSALHSVEMNAV